jgi:uncharacterized DUF497 family protein
MLLRQHQFLPRYDAQSGPRPISCVGCGGLRARVVSVVHAWTPPVIRVISIRKATRREEAILVESLKY